MSGDDEEWSRPLKKRRKPSGRQRAAEITTEGLDSAPMYAGKSNGTSVERRAHSSEEKKDKSITIASTAKLAPKTVAPFLAKHIPAQYAPLGGANGKRMDTPENLNSRFCYRHRPDMLCRRQADEPSMDKLQKDLETLSQDDRQGVAHVWSLFSAAPSTHRNLMLQGILAQCCFPQLSYLSANVRELIRIDFLSALPAEVSFRILCFLDTTSLCKAAQVSRKWRQLADDDVVWHRMCEQHIDRKCTKCGWGLPLLERKRLRASKRQIQLRATGRGLNAWSPDISPNPEAFQAESLSIGDHHDEGPQNFTTKHVAPSATGKLSPPISKKRPNAAVAESDYFRKTRPWKDVYKDRFKVGTNWKYGRCSTKILKGHTNGVMCLQFYDNILATGSYDATINIWDIETGQELRTLRGHTMGVRCLQFDDTKLISGSLDRTLKVWNWRTGECISTYNGHSEGVLSLHFDSNILVSGSIDKTAKIWNFRDKSTVTLRGHTDWVNAVRIDSASRTVFTASDDTTIRLWDLDTMKCIRTFEGHVAQVQQVVPLPRDFELEDDLSLHHTDDTGSVTSSAEVSSPNVQRRVVCPDGIIYSETFHYSQNRIAPPGFMLTSSLDSTIRLWEVGTGRSVRTFFGHLEGVWALGADSLRVVSGAEDRMIKVWDPRTGNCQRTFTGHAGPVTCIGLSDSRMCSGSEDGEVRLYSFTD